MKRLQADAVRGPRSGGESGRVYFVTGTGTGVGKTVLSAWWTAWLRGRGVRVRAVKPLASGGRADARRLQRAQGGEVTLDAVNPWWFRAALTPLVAARREGRRVDVAEVLAFLGSARKAADVLVIEGAGGLCSPLGEGWDARDLIVALDAIPVVVAANRLGVLNEVRLTLEALPARFARRTAVALMAPARPGVVARTNAEVLEGWYGAERVIRFPWIEEAAVGPEPSRWPAGLRRALAGWAGNGGRGPLR